MDNAIERCRADQRRAARYILEGGSDIRGAQQGMADWLMEEILRTGTDEHLPTNLFPAENT